MTWGAEEWAAFGAVASAVITLVLGTFAAIQIFQTRRIRQDEARPYVIVDFEFNGWTVYLAISNAGATPAFDVSFDLDRPISTPRPARDGVLAEVLGQTIPMLAPGRVIRVVFGKGPEFFMEGATSPIRYYVTATYRHQPHKRLRSDPPLVLDLKTYKHAVALTDPLRDTARALKDIDKKLQHWDSFHGLKVRVWDEHRAARREARADRLVDARHHWRAGGARAVARWLRNR